MNNSEISKLGKMCDEHIDNANIDELKLAVTNLEKHLDTEDLFDNKIILLYYKANVLQKIGSMEDDLWGSRGWNNQTLIAHRQIFKLCEELNLSTKIQTIFAQTQINHANLLATLCRVNESFTYYNKGLNKSRDSTETGLANWADKLAWYSRRLYSERDEKEYQIQAYKLIRVLIDNLETLERTDIKKNLLPNSTHRLRALYDAYHEKGKDLPDELEDEEHDAPKISSERKYKKWCKENSLCLNFLNDFDNTWFAANDSLVFPSYTAKIDAGSVPYLAAAFSQMTNEWCYTRYQFYSATEQKLPAYLSPTYLVDTLDGVLYSADIEQVKSAIVGCFNVLDKIAMILSVYLDIGTKQNGFNQSWFEKHIKDKISNPFVIALYWFGKDFNDHRDSKERPAYWNEPHAFEIRELRNGLAHNWVRVTEYKNPRDKLSDGSADYAYTLTKDELVEKGLYILKQTRFALLNVCLAVHFEEKQKKENTPTNSLAFIQDVQFT